MLCNEQPVFCVTEVLERRTRRQGFHVRRQGAALQDPLVGGFAVGSGQDDVVAQGAIQDPRVLAGVRHGPRQQRVALRSRGAESGDRGSARTYAACVAARIATTRSSIAACGCVAPYQGAPFVFLASHHIGLSRAKGAD